LAADEKLRDLATSWNALNCVKFNMNQSATN